jgi:hypothetical protein
MEKMKKKGMAREYCMQFVCALVTAWVLAVLISTLYVTTASGAIGLAALLWFGLQLPEAVGEQLWKQKSWTYVALVAGQHLITIAVMALILVAL